MLSTFSDVQAWLMTAQLSKWPVVGDVGDDALMSAPAVAIFCLPEGNWCHQPGCSPKLTALGSRSSFTAKALSFNNRLRGKIYESRNFSDVFPPSENVWGKLHSSAFRTCTSTVKHSICVWQVYKWIAENYETPGIFDSENRLNWMDHLWIFRHQWFAASSLLIVDITVEQFRLILG